VNREQLHQIFDSKLDSAAESGKNLAMQRFTEDADRGSFFISGFDYDQSLSIDVRWMFDYRTTLAVTGQGDNRDGRDCDCLQELSIHIRE
jgi:hypothetical protein